MKIFTAAQIKACDAYTIHASSIPSADLMERAAAKCLDWISAHLPKDSLFVVLCGPGNNGGDGLALTRLLHEAGYGAKAFLLQMPGELSPDCSLNLQRLRQRDESLADLVQPETFITDIAPNIVIIDAILGTGLNRPVEGWTGNFIRHINQLPNQIVAIDIPSGLPADNVPEGEEPNIIRADHTLSFQFYKRSFLHPESGGYAGKVHLLDIGLSQTFIQATHSSYQIIYKETIGGFYRPRPAFSHKGSFGTALMVGGQTGMMGALVLSVRACYRTGAGKVRALAPETGQQIIQTTVPEALCQTGGRDEIAQIRGWEEADAVGIGPGMGTDIKTVRAFEEFIENNKKPIVIDADALNILGKKQELLHKLPAGSILTPHPKEFERMFGKTVNSMLGLEHARTQAMRYNVNIVVKDRYTIVVTTEGNCWYNITGNAGLATAGSGDVLTGMITGLLAQGYKPADAAMLGVYLHGTAADLALEDQSMESLMAGDLLNYLGRAFKDLLQ